MNKTPQLNNFNHIKDRYLQAYNRVIVAFNLNDQGKEGEALAYLEQFNMQDKFSIGVLTADIKKRGFDAVKRTIRESVEPEGFDEGATA